MKAILGTVPIFLWGSVALAQQGPIPLLPAPMVSASVTASAATSSATPVETGYLRTTTESPEYCKHLHGRVGELLRDTKAAGSDSTEQVRSLTEEGERLCQNGQTRIGILQLRRAFILLNKAEPVR